MDDGIVCRTKADVKRVAAGRPCHVTVMGSAGLLVKVSRAQVEWLVTQTSLLACEFEGVLWFDVLNEDADPHAIAHSYTIS